MANALGTLFQNIASAIRAKTGETGTMKPAEFPEKIAAIETGGGGDIELLEDMEIELALSAGNQSIAAPDGYAVKSAIILKPSTLIPSNIKTGVTIAGVTGTLETSESTGMNFYGMTFSNMQYTISDSVTMASGPGNMSSVVLSSVPSTVTHIAAIPDDGYEYTKGCAWDWLGGHWVYDYRVHKLETFKVPHNGTIPSWEILDSSYAYGLISKSYEDSDGLEFKATNAYGNCTLRLFDSSGTIATYKVIVG